MRRRFAPALRFPALTRFYDTLAERFFRDAERKRRLVALGPPRAGEVVLDVGGGAELRVERTPFGILVYHCARRGRAA